MHTLSFVIWLKFIFLWPLPIICSSTIKLICNPLKVPFSLINLFHCTNWSFSLNSFWSLFPGNFHSAFKYNYLVSGNYFECLCPQCLASIKHPAPCVAQKLPKFTTQHMETHPCHLIYFLTFFFMFIVSIFSSFPSPSVNSLNAGLFFSATLPLCWTVADT